MGGAIAAGIIAGILGFLPLFASLRLARRSRSTHALTTGMYGLGGACVSLVVLVVCMIICALLERSLVLPFGIAEMLSIIAATTLYVVYKNHLAKRRKK